MVLSKRGFGAALGGVGGLIVLFGTWWLVLINSAGATITKLHKVFFGYSLSWGGGIIGFVWGFVYGFIAGFLFALIYNIVSSQTPKSSGT